MNIGSNNVSVIKTANRAVGTPIPVGASPFALAVTPNGKFAYVTNSGSNNVSVIKTANRAVGTPISVGGSPLGVALTPDGKLAYVANRSSNNVSVTKTATNTVVGAPADEPQASPARSAKISGSRMASCWPG